MTNGERGATVPQAVAVLCPDCREETLHRVLHGRMGTRGGLTLEATVECDRCGRVHAAVVREAPSIEVPVVVSRGAESRRTRVSLSADDVVGVEDELIVDGTAVLVTGIESRDGKRPPEAAVSEVSTLWVKDFESARVRVAINMRKRTIAKEIHALPTRHFTVGEELMFGRLRVTIHGIKIKGAMRRRGSAEARDIVRVFAKPTRGETLETPPPPSEEERAVTRPERAAEDVEAGAEDAWDEAWDALEDEDQA